MTRVFCPKCHRTVCDVVVSDGNTRIVVGKSTLVSLGKGNTVSGLSVQCPSKHKVLLDKYLPPPPPLRPWETDEAAIDTDGRLE
jgi:hypothetical protein